MLNYVATGLGVKGYQAAKKHVQEAGESLPQVARPELDTGTKGLLASQSARSQMSEEDIAGETLAGANVGENLVGDIGQDRTSRALGMVNDPAISQALARRSQKYFQSQQGGLKAKARGAASQDKFQRQQRVTSQYSAIEAQEKALLRRQQVHEKNVQAARNQATSDILGLGGTIVGGGAGAVAGGPQGAMTGAKIGGSASDFGGNTEMSGF